MVRLNQLTQIDLSPYVPKMKDLLAHRMLSSNSLKASEEISAWIQANDWVGEKISSNQEPAIRDLFTLNSLLTSQLPQARSSAIYTGEDQYLPPEFLGDGLNALEETLNSESHPLFRAFAIYLHIVTLHPFDNGNGRTARLAADWILLKSGYLPISFDSSVQSHVAITIGSPLRNKTDSFHKFLTAILNSYEILIGVESLERLN